MKEEQDRFVEAISSIHRDDREWLVKIYCGNIEKFIELIGCERVMNAHPFMRSIDIIKSEMLGDKAALVSHSGKVLQIFNLK